MEIRRNDDTICDPFDDPSLEPGRDGGQVPVEIEPTVPLLPTATALRLVTVGTDECSTGRLEEDVIDRDRVRKTGEGHGRV